MRMMLRIGDNTDCTDSNTDSTDLSRLHNQRNPFQISVISDKGVTLVEVLLAVVILSVGMVGVLRAYGACVGTLEVNRDVVNTIELLKEKMAEIEQGAVEQGGLSAGGSSGRFEGDWEDYAWESKTQTTSEEGLYELTLTVSSPARQLSLITYVQNKDYQPVP